MHRKQRRRDIFTGPPGAGKGTSGKAYAKKMGAGVLESSFVLSLEVQAETELGYRINYYRKNSLLVPDDDMVSVIGKYRHLFETPGHLVLDGFMRSVQQVEFMFTEKIVDPATDFLVHVHIQPTDLECKRRMVLRGRPENPDQRMDDYWKYSHPAVIRLHDLVPKRVTVEGDFSREEVTEQLLASMSAA